MTLSAVALTAVLILSAAEVDDAAGSVPPAAKFAALGNDAVRDVVILGETRPILLRLRIMIGDRSFRAVWLDGVRALHARLDHDGDGRLTVDEAEKQGLALLQATAAPAQTGQAQPGNRAEVDVNPKDGVISVDELAAALAETSGPFRLQMDTTAERLTDALFDQLDRDKDGQLTRPEMETIAGSLRRLDRDADELIRVDEASLLTAAVPAMMVAAGRQVRAPVVPTVLEIDPNESPVRLVRQLIKRYDKGSSRGPGRHDSRLSQEEFAIPAAAFDASDKNHDGLLSAEELRAYLEKAPRDAILDVSLPSGAVGRASVVVRGDDGGATSSELIVRQLSDVVVEIDVGLIRLDIYVDDGAEMAESARKELRTRFESADANQDGYLTMEELGQNNGLASPLAALFKSLDRDGDGKLYPRELDEYVATQVTAARGRLTLTASNEGRALFGMLDKDSDRQLGSREVLDAFARVSGCDRDGDGRVTSEEIPHQIRLTLGRGDPGGLLAAPANQAVVVLSTGAVASSPRLRPAAGPNWFRKMDRNRDGDVSPREFLGTREQFDRLDRDHDGLLSPEEASAAAAVERPKRVKAPGG